jgi:YVTN family beta-propeller protein
MKISIKLMTPLLLSLAVPATYAQQSGRLLVAEKAARSLAIVDPDSAKVIATVPEGGNTGHEVTGSPDGRFAYVPIYGDSGVGKPGTDGLKLDKIDIASAKIVDVLDFGHGVRPHLPVFGPKDGLLYVGTEIDHSITQIDPATLKIVGTLPTGQPESHMFSLSHDGRRAYTANVGPGTVSVIDIAARKTLAVIPVSPEIQRMSISNDDRKVFTSDVRSPRLAVISTATNKITDWITMPGAGYGSAPTPDGRWLLIAIPDKNQVAVIDLKSMKVAHIIDVSKSPQEVLVRPDGKVAYVSCIASNQVAEMDLATWKTTRYIDTGKGPDGLGWAAAH